MRAPVAVHGTAERLLVEPQLLRDEEVAGLRQQAASVRAARLRLQPGLLLRLVLQLLRLAATKALSACHSMNDTSTVQGSPVSSVCTGTFARKEQAR